MDYAGLKTAVQTWLDRSDASLIAAIPQFIQFAEAVFNRRLRTIWQECQTSTPLLPTPIVEATRGIYALPPDWLGHRYVFIRDPNLVMVYYQRIPALSDTVTTNWLLEAHPDLYLYTTLGAAEAWLKNDPRLPVWQQAAATFLDDLDALGEHAKYDGQDLVCRPRENTTTRIRYLDSANFADLEQGDAPAFTVTGKTLRIWPLP